MNKRLYKDSENKKIAGVCQGLGEYLNIDPNIIRILATVIACATAGTGIIVYIVAAIILPDKSELKKEEIPQEKKEDS